MSRSYDPLAPARYVVASDRRAQRHRSPGQWPTSKTSRLARRTPAGGACFSPELVNGEWRFETDTSNTYGSSNTWTIRDSGVTFSEDICPPAQPIAIGDASSPAITEEQIFWYGLDHADGQVRFSTPGSQLDELDELDGAISRNDTIITLYDSTWTLVKLDQDSGPCCTNDRL